MRRIAAMIALSLVLGTTDTIHAQHTVTVTPVTGATPDGFAVQISGNHLAWWGTDTTGGTDREIFHYDHSTGITTQVSNNTFTEDNPQLYGTDVVWWGQPGATASREIYHWNGTTTVDITNDPNEAEVRDEIPMIYDRQVVYWRQTTTSGATRELISYDLDTQIKTPLTSNAIFDGDHYVGQGGVIWIQNSTPNARVRFDDGMSQGDVGGNTRAIESPHFHGSTKVWEGFTETSPGIKDIYMNSGSGPVNITNSAINDFDPKIFGNDIVYWGGVFQDNQVRHYNIQTGIETPLSTGELNQFPQISAGNVVWQGKQSLADDFEIYFWDGTTVQQLTDNAFDDTNPQIYGNRVAWLQVDGDSDVMLAQVGQTGDLNLDGNVDIFDVGVISDNWETNGPLGDANYDLTVDIFDVGTVSDNWTDTEGGGAQAVPEPATLWLAAIGLLAITFSRRAWRRSR